MYIYNYIIYIEKVDKEIYTYIFIFLLYVYYTNIILTIYIYLLIYTSKIHCMYIIYMY